MMGGDPGGLEAGILRGSGRGRDGLDPRPNATWVLGDLAAVDLQPWQHTAGLLHEQQSCSYCAQALPAQAGCL
jgi:hypothetical protein